MESTLSAAAFVSGRNAVSFTSEGTRLAAHLYLPPGFTATHRYPAIVLVRPATGVKEQTAGLYAEALARTGFVTFTFDPRGFGESEGRRAVEDPFRIAADARQAFTYVAGLPFVDARNLFAGGVCMGGPYAALAAVDDPRIRAVASITPYLTMHEDYPALWGGRRITLALARLTDLVVRVCAAVGIEICSYAVPPTRWLAALPFTLPIARGMRDYYLPGQPGHCPTWRNRINWASQLSLIRFDPFTMIAPSFRRPFYLAYGSKGYSPLRIQQFFESLATPAADRQLRVVDGTHFEIYWQPRFVEPIVEDVRAFFSRYIV